MKTLTPKRGSELAEQLFATALAAGEVSPEDKHGFVVGVMYLIEHIEQREFADWQSMPGPADSSLT